MPKLSEGDSISMTGEVTIVHDDGSVHRASARLRHSAQTRGEHLALVAKRKQRRKQLHDEW